MKIFTIKKINKLGDYDEEWGQTFWAETHEQQMPVKFTKQIKFLPAIDSKIMAEEYEVKPGKNGDFMALKKVKVEEGTETEQSFSGVPNPPLKDDMMTLLILMDEKLTEILQKLDPPKDPFPDAEV